MRSGDRSCIPQRWRPRQDLLIRIEVTLVEAVQTDHLYLEISIEGHLPIDVLTESGLAGCRTTSNTDDDSLDRLLNETVFSDFE